MTNCRYYVTPLGMFATLADAGRAHELTREGARIRFASPNYPDWQSHVTKWQAKPRRVKKYLAPTFTKREEVIPKQPRTEPRTWTVYNTENMGRHLRKGVRTPQGDFPSIALAAEHYKVSAPCMSNWIKSPVYGRPGFEFFNELETA